MTISLPALKGGGSRVVLLKIEAALAMAAQNPSAP